MADAAALPPPRRPGLEHETRLLQTGVATLIAGIDEAGRGPLAGPVVAAAVILPGGFFHRRLDDSKKLSPTRRTVIYRELINDPRVCWAVAAVEAQEVDHLNILRATHEAMRRAFGALPRKPDHALIDGLPVHPFPVSHTAIVGGDGVSLSIAAASVIAKVTRDRRMDGLGRPLSRLRVFARHKGYATSHHFAILARDGPCPIHRYSFRPVAQPVFSFAQRRPAA